MIKTEKRTRLFNEALDDLLMITSNNVPLKDFNPEAASLFGQMRRLEGPIRKKRRKYKRRKTDIELDNSDSKKDLNLLNVEMK